jgi:sugar phosphate isomerase/epimerase
MKLSCLPVSLFSDFADGRLDIVSWGEQARRIGFDGFDISSLFIKNHTPTYLTELKKGIDGTGIPLVMVSGYPDFVHPDAGQRRREAAYLVNDIAVTSELGGKYLRVLAGQAHPGMSREAGVALAVKGLREAAPAAEQFGVTLVYENHAKPGAWHYIDFSFPPDIFLDVFEGIRDTSIRLNFDVGNSTAEASAEGDELKLLAKVIDKVETLHVCDMKERGRFSPTLVGTGVTPLPELFRFIREHRFDGWLCIEEAGGLGMDGVQKAHDYVREIWEQSAK